jgi:hypothetical protein
VAFVVFAGQSNMGGAAMTAATLTRAWTPDPKTLIWDPASKAWRPLQPGTNTGFGQQAPAWGPEVEFARAFRAAFPDETLHILKSTHGGTSLAPDPGLWRYDWHPDSPDELVDVTAAMIAEASAALGGQKPGALFWGQGETDAEQPAAAAAYSERLARFFTTVRAEWLQDAEGPIGFFRIGGTPPHASQVRAAQAAVDAGDPHARSFDTLHFPYAGDGVHLTAAGYDLIGAHFFRLLAEWRGVGDALEGRVVEGTPAADSLAGGGGDDTIAGSWGSDVLRGGEGRDLLNGGAAFDDMHGNQGADTLAGGDGDDWVVGGKDGDRLFGDDGADIVYGNMGADLCDGGPGDDLVRGGQDDDILFGRDGADWLSGDRGDDTVSGGAGADVFHSFAEAGLDLITDFNFAEGDRVRLEPGASYAVRQQGADVVIEMTAARVVLQGVQLTSLGEGWLTG